MALAQFVCCVCYAMSARQSGAINRAARVGMNLYCGKKCSGIGRRLGKTKPQMVAEKREYDKKYQDRMKSQLKKKKRAYHLRTYNPAAAAVERKAKMPRHLEYCRRPEYRKKKHQYDQMYLAKKHYGPFWEAALAVRALDEEVSTRVSRYEIAQQNGTLNKSTSRKRDYERTLGI